MFEFLDASLTAQLYSYTALEKQHSDISEMSVVSCPQPNPMSEYS